MRNFLATIVLLAIAFFTLNLFPGVNGFFKNLQEDYQEKKQNVTEEYHRVKTTVTETSEKIENTVEAVEGAMEKASEAVNKVNDLLGEEEEASDNFRLDEKTGEYYGRARVEGYASTVERPEAFCEEDCKVYNYVFFNVLHSDNQYISEYIEQLQGNSFVGENSIGLGCVEDGRLWTMNSSDEFGLEKYTTDPEVSEAILNSSKEEPITIELQRYLFTGGSGAPTCYSHFARINLAK